MTAYYNEHDDYAAQWLRNLIAAGHIASGEVDTRSIEDVRPSDLRGFTQCHFFAGVGVWSLALRRAGFPDDRNVWTGSCPCQPFSAAGKGDGFADERHLWPAWFHLIRECRPDTIFGEQVASKDGLGWADLVSTDLEGEAYAIGAFDTCAAGFRKPHIRQRLYWVANSPGVGRKWRWPGEESAKSGQIERPERLRDACRLADAYGGDACAERQQRSGQYGLLSQDGGIVVGMGNPDGSRTASRLPEALGRQEGHSDVHDHGDGRLPRSGSGQSEFVGLANEPRGGWGEERSNVGGRAISDSAQGVAAGLVNGSGGDGMDDADSRSVSIPVGRPEGRDGQRPDSADDASGAGWPGPIDILRTPADWLFCRDAKWRPVEPGSQPLAHGITGRVGRLRAYGNALDADQAEGFIIAYLEAEAAGFRTSAVGDGARGVDPLEGLLG